MNTKLLIVEDETALAEVLADYFEHLGYKVDCAYSTFAAEEMLKKNQYDVLLSDMRVHPGTVEDGFALIDYAHHQSPRTSIIALSSALDNVAERRARQMGAKAVLHKPKPLAEIAQVVMGCLSGNSGSTDRVETANLQPTGIQIARMIAHGQSRLAIAKHLCVSAEEVATILQSWMASLSTQQRLTVTLQLSREAFNEF
jgi:DNA-binding response OmpR family regulator